VQPVAFAREQGFGLQLGDVRIGGGEFLGEVYEQGLALSRVRLLVREMKIGIEIAQLAGKRFFRLYAFLELLALLQQGLGFFLILPEIRIAYFFLNRGELLLCGGRVKDSSLRAQSAC
jgi:hypothetical protein